MIPSPCASFCPVCAVAKHPAITRQPMHPFTSPGNTNNRYQSRKWYSLVGFIPQDFFLRKSPEKERRNIHTPTYGLEAPTRTLKEDEDTSSLPASGKKKIPPASRSKKRRGIYRLTKPQPLGCHPRIERETLNLENIIDKKRFHLSANKRLGS